MNSNINTVETPTIAKIQANLFEMLELFDRVCKENEIDYYIIGGTLLGAIRHNNFIPWDDDVDIGLFRDDYLKLMSLSQKVWGQDYVIKGPGDRTFPYPYSKLINKKTTIIEDIGYKFITGLYIDIFPIDGAGNTVNIGVKHYRRINRSRGYLQLSINNDYKAENIFKYLMQKMIKYIGPVFWKALIQNNLKKYKVSSSIYVGNMLGAWGEREIVEKRLFGKPQGYLIRGHKFLGPQYAAEYLEKIYGKYMELPPLEKRKSHHANIYVDLNQAYEKYGFMGE